MLFSFFTIFLGILDQNEIKNFFLNSDLMHQMVGLFI